MALATGPLLSLDARGKIGGALVFSNWKGRPTIRKLVTPSNPKTDAQTGQRAMMMWMGPAWGELNDPNKAQWQDLANQGKYSPFNAFTSYNLRRWTQFLWPQNNPGLTELTGPVMGALTAVGGVAQFSVSQVITTDNDMSGMAIAASMTTGFTPEKADVKRVVSAVATTPVTAVVTGLTPGTWFVRTLGFSFSGGASAWVAEEEVTVS